MSIEWHGTDEFSKWLNTLPDMTMRLLEGAMFTEAEAVMSKAKQRTPVDTGRLRSTGHVKPPRTSGGKVEVELAYGTEYAIFVHEILTAAHPVGQAKFLESAVYEAAPEFHARLKADVLDRIGRD